MVKEFFHDKGRGVIVVTDGEFKLVLSEQEFREVNKTGCSGLLFDLKKRKST